MLRFVILIIFLITLILLKPCRQRPLYPSHLLIIRVRFRNDLIDLIHVHGLTIIRGGALLEPSLRLRKPWLLLLLLGVAFAGHLEHAASFWNKGYVDELGLIVSYLSTVFVFCMEDYGFGLIRYFGRINCLNGIFGSEWIADLKIDSSHVALEAIVNEKLNWLNHICQFTPHDCWQRTAEYLYPGRHHQF